MHLCAPHDIIGAKIMPPSGRAHPQLYCVQIWMLIGPTVPKIQPILYPHPYSCSNTLPECQPLPIHLSHQIHHPWPTKLPVPVPLPTYNWAATDQMQEFCLFKCQLETWTRIHKVKGEEKLDYLFCIMGKEGYATMDRWVPADEVHKNDPVTFLDYIESTLDKKISPWVRVYELEDITKRSDKSIDELVNQICQLAQRAQIGNGSDAVIKFKVQCRLIQAFPDTNIELCKQLLKVSCDKRISHLLEICRTYFAVESGVAAMCVGHVVQAVCHACQTHDPKLLTSYTPCPNCTHQHPPSRNNCPAHDSAWKGCRKKGHWWAKCQSCNTTSPQVPPCQPHFKNHEKEREPQAAKANTEKRPPHKDLFVAALDCGTVEDVHPKEMIIDNISSQQCNEAYTFIKLPASTSSKGTTSVHVKIDTRSGGNILPLCLFQQLHPKQTSPDGLPISLDPIQTKLTAYNGVSDSLVQNPRWPHPLATKHPWSPTTHNPIHTGTTQTHLVLVSWVSQHVRS